MAKKSRFREAAPAKAPTGMEIAEERIAAWKRGDRAVREWISVRGRRHWITGVVDLRDLGLDAVPPGLRGLRGLSVVDLGSNRIRKLPYWFAQIPATIIELTGNQLRTLPNAPWSNTIDHLLLEDNQLEVLPQSLRTMSELETVVLDGNPGLGIPESILATRRADTILGYYFEARGGRALLELKLLLVGRGEAGKTTLAKRLVGEQPDEREPETHSIAIRTMTLDCPRGPVRTRAWDFGGQEILHSTHQFFLTERSLYLLVLEPRSNLAQRDAEYWLKLIETQGGGSPVIVVMNWSHDRPWRVDEVKLRRKFPFIVDFISTDALHGDGIRELMDAMVRTVEEWMPEVWLPFPGRWRMIKDQIAGMRENFLTYERYAKLCAAHAELDPEKQADLAEILHALGLALYFGNDPRLHDTRVLNPRWVTGGVYAVTRSPSIAASNGQLTVRDMPRVLREAEAQNSVKAVDYPPVTHQFILELMRAFQLCFASEDERRPGDARKPVRYLVPELLPEFEPEMPEPWEEAPIRLRYGYEVLPPGLLPRFIVRTHALSEGAPHWRHGVVLRHGETSALIREESDRPELYVFVLGGNAETRRVLVTMVRRELEALHAEMKMAPVEEMELTGEAERWIGVKALREMEVPAEPTKRLPVRPEGTAEVNVTRELNKLEPAAARAIDRDPATAPAPVRVFVSYAHDDERQLKRLDAILDVLEQQHGLVSWRDRRLIAGNEWDEEIRRRLEEMDIFLFIGSQMSLVRPYIVDPELKRAKERHGSGEVEIVTVKLEPCAADDDPYLGKLQRLASRFSSIAETNPRSIAWEQVRKDLLPVIERVRKKKNRAARRPSA
jgi:internalin A